mmetsp:Transcript_22634/g.43236  ORF Transcript_22634/g.43236 Transcript_22634/m.43236 type:complete len:219 (+) Transcript_22634:671-1327(+)
MMHELGLRCGHLTDSGGGFHFLQLSFEHFGARGECQILGARCRRRVARSVVHKVRARASRRLRVLGGQCLQLWFDGLGGGGGAAEGVVSRSGVRLPPGQRGGAPLESLVGGAPLSHMPHVRFVVRRRLGQLHRTLRVRGDGLGAAHVVLGRLRGLGPRGVQGGGASRRSLRVVCNGHLALGAHRFARRPRWRRLIGQGHAGSEVRRQPRSKSATSLGL